MPTSILQGFLDYSATPAKVDRRGFLGSALSADWRHGLVARGLVWHSEVGAFSTPIVGGGNGTAIDLDQPEFLVSVPKGKTLIPLRIDINTRPGVQTTDNHESELLLAADIAAAYDGTGTVTTESPINLRTDIGAACPATVRSACTADLTDPTLGFELAHRSKLTDVQGTAATVNLYSLDLHYEPDYPPFFVGPACMYGYWGGDVAVTGFAVLEFAVIDSNLITGLS